MKEDIKINHKPDGPFYSCEVTGCAEEMSYEPDELFWSAKHNMWVCVNCWEDFHFEWGESDELIEEPMGISFWEYLKEEKANETVS